MFRVIRLREMFGFGFDIARTDYNEYSWWEFELHVTFMVWYTIITVNRHV